MVTLRPVTNRIIYIVDEGINVFNRVAYFLLGYDDRLEQAIFELRRSGDRLFEAISLLHDESLITYEKSKDPWYVKEEKKKSPRHTLSLKGQRVHKASLHTGRRGGRDAKAPSKERVGRRSSRKNK